MKKIDLLMSPQASGGPTTNNWYSIKAAAGVAEIQIYQEIGGWGVTAQQFARDLKALGKLSHINAHIHSPGGDVFEGMAIYNILKGHPAHKVAIIDGLAASMASVIAMAFDEVLMPESSYMMVHKPWGGIVGDANDMRDTADLLDKVEGSLIGAYAKKTGLSDDEIRALLAAETWMTGAEAVEKGFADRTTDAVTLNAQLTSTRNKDWKNMPQMLNKLFNPQANVPAAALPPAVTAPSAPAPAIDASAARLAGINSVFANFQGHNELLIACLSDPACTPEQAKDKLLAKLGQSTTPAMPQNHGHITNGNLVGDSVKAAILARTSLAQAERDNRYNHFTLFELARASLADRGIAVGGLNRMALAGMAFTHSGSDFGSILLDVANKALLMGWEQAEETFDLWTRKGTLTDFKTSNRVGLNELGALREVRPGAEYKYITTGDRSEKIALATYGELMSITRQAIINDDLDVLSRIPMMMGAAARGTIGDLVYAVLTKNAKLSSGKGIFHADHKNIQNGSLSVESLSSARTLMKNQKSASGRALNIRPEFLLVPNELETTATQIIGSASVKGADANSGVINPIKDFVKVIAETRLSDDSVVKSYLTAGAGRDTIEVAYLDGIDLPYIEQQDGFSSDGVVTKVRIDAGVAPMDYRGLVSLTGV